MDETCLVTGANRGIGRAFAGKLREAGAQVIATVRDPDASASLDDDGVRVERVDVADDRSVSEMARRLKDKPIDILINNAAIGGQGPPVAELDMTELSRFFEVNSIGPLRVARALLPNLRLGRRRTIVNISSDMGSVASNDSGGFYGYRASKSGLNMLTSTLAHELRPEQFTCVLLHPGWVRTDMGGSEAPRTPDQSVADMIRLIEGLTPDDNGRFIDHKGGTIPW